MGCGGSKEGASAPTKPEAGADAKGTAAVATTIQGASTVPLHSKYELGKTLGSGSFATARIATVKATGEKVAIKTLMRSHDNFDKELLEHEITVMRKLNSQYCIQLIEVVEDAKAVHLVEELATGGELFDRILELGHFSEKDAARVINQVMQGIAHMHDHGACHRDLKPENLLMLSGEKDSPDYNRVKIADFGLSSLRPTEDSSMSTVCGTPDYLAPEVIMIAAEGPHSRRKYDAKVDVWAIGVILYTMICGFPPFWSENMAEMLHLIKHGEYSFPSPSWDKVAKSTKDFITMMLTTDPNKRPTSRECLQHPFLADAETLSGEDLEQKETLHKYVESRRTGKIFRAVRVVARMEIATRNQHSRENREAADQKAADGQAAETPAQPAPAEPAQPA